MAVINADVKNVTPTHPLTQQPLLKIGGIIRNVNLISVDLCGNQMNHIPPASCPYKAILPDTCLFHWDFCCASRLIICEFVNFYLGSLAKDTINVSSERGLNPLSWKLLSLYFSLKFDFSTVYEIWVVEPE